MSDIPAGNDALVARPKSGEAAASGPLSGLLGKLQGLLGGRDGETINGARLEAVLEEHLDNDRVFTQDERRILINLLSFGDLRVDDVMVPRADIKALEIGEPLDAVLDAFAAAGHSRLPVYRETLDDPVGMVHIKDVVAFIAGERGRAAGETGEPGAAPPAFRLGRLKRDVLFVPRSMPALDLLVKMQASRVHMALVIDEYGGTDGLVSIEDLVEGIVGDIEDEHDRAGADRVIAREDGSLEIDARVDVEELESRLGVELMPEDREEDVDTVGGLIVALVGRVPQRGELIAHPAGLEFEILDADPRRLKRLRLHLPSALQSSVGTETS